MWLYIGVVDGRVPLYHRVADQLREQLQHGYGSGAVLPSEDALGAWFGVGRMTVRRAVAVLREEGLITTGRGRRAIVRGPAVRVGVVLTAGQRVVVRMPSSRERVLLGIDAGVPVLEVSDPSDPTGTVQLLAGDRVEIRGPAPATDDERPSKRPA